MRLMASPRLALLARTMIPLVVGGFAIPYPRPTRKVKEIAARIVGVQKIVFFYRQEVVIRL